MMSRQDVQNHVLLFSFRVKLSSHLLFHNLCCLIVAVSHAVLDIIHRSDRYKNAAADDLEDSEQGHVEDIISMSSIKLYLELEFHNTGKEISQVNESPTHISSLTQST